MGDQTRMRRVPVEYKDRVLSFSTFYMYVKMCLRPGLC